MDFNDALALDNIVYQMRLADYPRGLNRARINDLMNGLPPYSVEEQNENEIEVNVNELSGPVAAHDARSQFYNAFLKPGNFFTLTTDSGPRHYRADYGHIVTKHMNRIMKRSMPYIESFRSKLALDVLHGIAPACWRDEYAWCPESVGVEDVMIPANTLLTMQNLPLFAVYRQFTARELIRLTRGPRRDRAWNMDLVDACIRWVDSQALKMMGTNWPQIWSPEKQAERIKGDGGFYIGDQVPTVDCWDIYFWNDSKNHQGWCRRMILDAWSQPVVDGSIGQEVQMARRKGAPHEKPFDNQFLYNSENRVFAQELSNIITWQFADLSAVAPFRYHSVRSLGFLLYSVCHLQNRLYSKFTEAQFEQMMMYFRVKSADDMQRALRVDLVNRGFIDDTVQFIPAAERYQINERLIEAGINLNREIIGRNSSSFNGQPPQQDKRELTATQWMGEANKVTALVSSALNQAYIYQNAEYNEIVRRFMKKNSKCPDVLKFQANCMRDGVPSKLLFCAEAWESEPERVMGAGNKTLEMAIADRLLGARNLFDPEPQRQILRDWTLSITDDPARAESLVPRQPQISDSILAASFAAGTLMDGMEVPVKSGINHVEWVETLLASMATKIKQIHERDGMGEMEELQGLQNMAQHIGQQIAKIAEDPNEKQRVKKYGDQLKGLMNLVKAFSQRLMEKLQSEQQQGGMSPEVQAKIANDRMMMEAKAANTRESHAQRTAQRQIQFEMKAKQDADKAQQDLNVKAAQAGQELDTQRQKAEIELQKERQKAETAAAKPAESAGGKE